MQVLSVPLAIGDAGDQSDVYLKAAVQHGATEQEILDVVNLAYTYAGAPRAVTAARRMAPYLAESRSKFPPGTTETLVALDDHRTMVWDSHGEGVAGKSVPMLLMHALDMDHSFWRAVFPALAAQGRTIAYDIRGHGHARGAPLITSSDQLVNDVRCLLDRLEVPVADVYGASYGGAVAQWAALGLPGRVRSLGLIATGTYAPEKELAARATDAEQHGMEAQVAKSLIRWFLPETIAQDLWMVRYARNCVRRSRPEEWAAAWRNMATLDVRAQAATLDMPVFFLSGKQDLSATPELMLDSSKAYKNMEFYSVDPGTHMLVMEQPEAAAAALVHLRDKVERQFRLSQA